MARTFKTYLLSTKIQEIIKKINKSMKEDKIIKIQLAHKLQILLKLIHSRLSLLDKAIVSTVMKHLEISQPDKIELTCSHWTHSYKIRF